MKRLTLIILGVLLCTPLYSDMNPYIAGVPVSGGSCDSACDPESNEVGVRGSGVDSGNIAAGSSIATLYTPDCSGYLDMAYVFQGNIALMSGPVKIFVYLDDGDSVPDSGDELIAKTASITGGTASTWYNSAITESCVSVSTENSYWIVIACDDDSANGFRNSYSSGTGGTSYTSATGDYYDAEPSTLGAGEWGSPTSRRTSVYVTID
jgi:hypothetical protein